ncbi:hypothetical protein [Amycolatopsis sp. EV170708-02-1]|uniref:hypothetical protein n=1 Tax=Amycolatopsis sp. EV170708-02-1 TaxID=2919322 RepID=UPI001F0BA6A5|nr:hypothetical protein [Amycolatopsis sp. EV170708-02-1]UMP02156.1 hypothetical protein MJQ72_38095 [Amycolatopsis sp. EV170708-02-1]
MAIPPGQDPQPVQQQPDAPPMVVSVSGPMDPVGEPARPGRLEPRRLVAAGLASLALVLALVGCFFPLFKTEHRFAFDTSEQLLMVFVQSAWDTTALQTNEPAFTTSSSPLGIPLLVAAALLLAAAIVSARAAGRPGAMDRWLTTIAAVFLTGVVSTIATLSAGRQLGDDVKVVLTLEAGMWALLAAVVAAVGAAVMSHRVQDDAVPVSGDSALAEMPTPKDGISITVLPPEPPDYSAFAPPPDPGAKERD